MLKNFSYLITTVSGRYQQNPAQAMIIMRVIGADNLLLDCNLHNVRIYNFKFAYKHFPLPLYGRGKCYAQ